MSLVPAETELILPVEDESLTFSGTSIAKGSQDLVEAVRISMPNIYLLQTVQFSFFSSTTHRAQRVI